MSRTMSLTRHTVHWRGWMTVGTDCAAVCTRYMIRLTASCTLHADEVKSKADVTDPRHSWPRCAWVLTLVRHLAMAPTAPCCGCSHGLRSSAQSWLNGDPFVQVRLRPRKACCRSQVSRTQRLPRCCAAHICHQQVHPGALPVHLSLNCDLALMCDSSKHEKEPHAAGFMEPSAAAAAANQRPSPGCVSSCRRWW